MNVLSSFCPLEVENRNIENGRKKKKKKKKKKKRKSPLHPPHRCSFFFPFKEKSFLLSTKKMLLDFFLRTATKHFLFPYFLANAKNFNNNKKKAKTISLFFVFSPPICFFILLFFFSVVVDFCWSRSPFFFFLFLLIVFNTGIPKEEFKKNVDALFQRIKRSQFFRGAKKKWTRKTKRFFLLFAFPPLSADPVCRHHTKKTRGKFWNS